MVIIMRSSKKKKQSFLKRLLKFTLLLLVVGIGIVLYSRFIGTSVLVVKEYQIKNELFEKNFHGFKILHLSDIHYLTTIDYEDMKKVVNKINEINPDMVVLTGDLLDETIEYSNKQIEALEELLSQIKVTTNKYAITGNHDIKKTEWETIIKNSGFVNLNDTYDFIYHGVGSPIMISGISSNLDSPEGIQTKIKPIEEKMDETLPAVDQNGKKLYTIHNPIYHILMIHEPDYIESINYHKFNLILAGHSHNGQIRLPFIGGMMNPKGAKNYSSEEYTLDETKLFVSGGLGTSKIKYRFFNRPSINLYRLSK